MARVPCPHAADLPPNHWVCDECRRRRGLAQKKARRDAVTPRCRYCQAELPRGRRTCDECKLRLQREQYARWMAVPGNRAKQNQSRREWAQRNPDRDREWKRRRFQDPVLRARDLESQRLWHRLQREQQGRPSPPVPEGRWRGGRRNAADPEPLAQAIHGWLDDGKRSQEELAVLTGVHPRRIWGVLNGERVSLSIADRLAVGLGVHLDVLYPPKETAA